MRFSHLTLCIGLTISITAAAEDVKIVGTMDHTIKAPRSTLLKNAGTNANVSEKHIKLLKIKLSDKMKQSIAKKLNSDKTPSNLTFAGSSPNRVQLGMNNVPVLDQGHFGTCATFAVTAAVDAALNKGDYVSQLCLLQLGNFLEQNANIPSGWDGSLNFHLLNQINMFGIVDKVKQKTYGCGGLTEYPSKPSSEQTPSSEMSPYDYHQINTSLQKDIGWSTVIDEFTLKENQSASAIINNIKAALNGNDRLAFGVMLVDINLGTTGAVGKYHVTNDTWILTPEIIRDTNSFFDGLNPGFQYGGHAMIITGYDDNALAIDKEGRAYRGLFTLRNSWGKAAGDGGEFYMSYNYLASLTMEAQRIRKRR